MHPSSTVKKEIIFELRDVREHSEVNVHIIPTYGKSYTLTATQVGENIYRVIVSFNPHRDGQIHYEIKLVSGEFEESAIKPYYSKYMKRKLLSLNIQTYQQQIIRLSNWFQHSRNRDYILYLHSKLKGPGHFELCDENGTTVKALELIDQYSQRFFQFSVPEAKFKTATCWQLCYVNGSERKWVQSDLYFSEHAEQDVLNLKQDLKIFNGKPKRNVVQLRTFEELEDLLVSPLLHHFDAVMLPPVFLSTGQSQYEVTNFSRPIAELGSWESYREKVEQLKARGLNVIQDMNINFVHSSHPILHDATFVNSPKRFWFNKPDLIELNFDNPQVVAYFQSLIQSFRHDYGVDQFRLDCGNELPISFYQEHTESLIYETWYYPSPELNALGVGNLNYTFLWGFLESFGERPITVHRLICETLSNHFPFDLNQNYNYISSHDTDAYLEINGESNFLKALTLLTALPGHLVLLFDELRNISDRPGLEKLLKCSRQLDAFEIPQSHLDDTETLWIRTTVHEQAVKFSNTKDLVSVSAILDATKGIGPS